MTAIPTSSPIADVRTGRLLTPWQRWLSELQATITSLTGGTLSGTDDDARLLAADATADSAALAARVAMLERRISDLEVQASGVVP